MQKGRNKAEEKMSGYDINQFSPKEGKKKVLRMTTKKVHLLNAAVFPCYMYYYYNKQ